MSDQSIKFDRTVSCERTTWHRYRLAWRYTCLFLNLEIRTIYRLVHLVVVVLYYNNMCGVWRDWSRVFWIEGFRVDRSRQFVSLPSVCGELSMLELLWWTIIIGVHCVIRCYWVRQVCVFDSMMCVVCTFRSLKCVCGVFAMVGVPDIVGSTYSYSQLCYCLHVCCTWVWSNLGGGVSTDFDGWYDTLFKLNIFLHWVCWDFISLVLSTLFEECLWF